MFKLCNVSSCVSFASCHETEIFHHAWGVQYNARPVVSSSKWLRPVPFHSRRPQGGGLPRQSQEACRGTLPLRGREATGQLGNKMRLPRMGLFSRKVSPPGMRPNPRTDQQPDTDTKRGPTTSSHLSAQLVSSTPERPVWCSFSTFLPSSQSNMKPPCTLTHPDLVT